LLDERTGKHADLSAFVPGFVGTGSAHSFASRYGTPIAFVYIKILRLGINKNPERNKKTLLVLLSLT
jgi:hypothetical protein